MVKIKALGGLSVAAPRAAVAGVAPAPADARQVLLGFKLGYNIKVLILIGSFRDLFIMMDSFFGTFVSGLL